MMHPFKTPPPENLWVSFARMQPFWSSFLAVLRRFRALNK